jgi:hypothetical protein
MLAIIAAVLVVLWLLGFLAFHATSGLIHLLLICAVISFIAHFFRGRTQIWCGLSHRVYAQMLVGQVTPSAHSVRGSATGATYVGRDADKTKTDISAAKRCYIHFAAGMSVCIKTSRRSSMALGNQA